MYPSFLNFIIALSLSSSLIISFDFSELNISWSLILINIVSIFFVISGGGWTTVLYSAIDDRISSSFPVAGSLPIFLRVEAKNVGDYEQIVSGLYQNTNYLELYLMGSYGKDRKQIQIFNEFDPCCFSGNFYTYYDDVVKLKLSSLGEGKFDVILDSSHKKHIISDNALNQIIDELS